MEAREGAGPTGRGRRRIGIVAVLLILVATVGLAIYRAHTPRARRIPLKDQVQSVVVAPVVAADVPVYLRALGTVTPLDTVTVRAQVAGTLIRVLFTEGQRVRRGQWLMQMDARPFQIQLEQARAQQARDQALLQTARTDLVRYKTLYAEQSIAEQQLATQAGLVQQDEALLKADQAQVDNARLALQYAHITAPIDGRVGLRQVDAGNYVTPADTNGLVTITETSPTSVLFSIPEAALPTVWAAQAHHPLAVTFYSRDGSSTLGTGTVSAINNTIDPSTGTIKIRATAKNHPERLFPNQFVNVALRVQTLPHALVVPSAAIQQGARGAFVFVVTPGPAVRTQEVQLGPTESGQVVVTQGLRVGAEVVVDGTERLRTGQKIRLVKGAPGQSSTGAAAPR